MKKIDYTKWNTIVKIYDPNKGSKTYINGSRQNLGILLMTIRDDIIKEFWR